jgi:hypothetical protein
MIGILVGAAILGIIIAVMEEGEFPGLLKMILCVLAATIPALIVNAFLPAALFIVGLAVGAVCAGCAISFLCGMGVKRATIAAGIYLAIETMISAGFYFLLS